MKRTSAPKTESRSRKLEIREESGVPSTTRSGLTPTEDGAPRGERRGREDGGLKPAATYVKQEGRSMLRS